MKVISSKRCWEYRAYGHPESPERVRRTYEYLTQKGFEIIEPVGCKDSDILLVHSKALLEEVKSENFYEPDTPAIKGIYNYALLSAGGAILSSEEAIKGEPSFSLMRPPGHHVTRTQLGGFCYFNNIAIAVRHLLHRKSINSVAILDIDCHHGNGTQDIFLGEDKVLFVSLHQVPLYPGTGLVSEKNCLNFPLPPGTGEKKYLDTLEKAIKEIQKFKPEILAISAGFDTYKDDPITDIKLEKISYKKIAEMISALKIPVFAVLEGGYSPDLPECIYNFLLGFKTI